MGLIDILRERIGQHPTIRVDPVFGEMEQAGPGVWQTIEPVPFLPGMEGVSVTVEGEAGPDTYVHEAFGELSRRYEGLKASMRRCFARRRRGCGRSVCGIMRGWRALRFGGSRGRGRRCCRWSINWMMIRSMRT